MAIVQMTRKQDERQIPSDLTAPAPLDHSFFWGEWQNTDDECTGIVRVVFFDKDGALNMRISGAGESKTIDWGDIEVSVFADNVDSLEGTKFSAVYEFDFMQVRMHGWVKLGVLVISVFNFFTDGSGRSNYFDREFFFAV